MEQNKKKNQTGFYIAVCCCVMVLGITGYVTNRNKTQNSNLPQPTQQVAKITHSPAYTPTPTQEVSAPLPVQQAETVISTMSDPEQIDIVETGEPSEFYEENVITSVTQNPDPTFIMPIEGKIGEEFSADALTFNKALGDWRTHNGIDIVSEDNKEVLISSDGVVKEITNDYMGCTVIISHANGYESVYSCLKPVEKLEIGADVTQGDVLGEISDAPQGENLTKPHLHFEIYSDGTPKNPMDIITE